MKLDVTDNAEVETVVRFNKCVDSSLPERVYVLKDIKSHKLVAAVGIPGTPVLMFTHEGDAEDMLVGSLTGRATVIFLNVLDMECSRGLLDGNLISLT